MTEPTLPPSPETPQQTADRLLREWQAGRSEAKALADKLAEALGECVEALEPYADADQPDPTLPVQANAAMRAMVTAAEALAAYDATLPDARGALTAEAAR